MTIRVNKKKCKTAAKIQPIFEYTKKKGEIWNPPFDF